MPGDTLPPHAVEARDRAAWRRWLMKHHGQAAGVWLVMAREGSDHEAPGVDEAVDEALAFGWLDSKTGRLDERRSLLWFAPRKPKSAWSAPHRRRVEALEAAGLMHASGRPRSMPRGAAGCGAGATQADRRFVRWFVHWRAFFEPAVFCRFEERGNSPTRGPGVSRQTPATALSRVGIKDREQEIRDDHSRGGRTRLDLDTQDLDHRE